MEKFYNELEGQPVHLPKLLYGLNLTFDDNYSWLFRNGDTVTCHRNHMGLFNYKISPTNVINLIRNCCKIFQELDHVIFLTFSNVRINKSDKPRVRSNFFSQFFWPDGLFRNWFLKQIPPEKRFYLHPEMLFLPIYRNMPLFSFGCVHVYKWSSQKLFGFYSSVMWLVSFWIYHASMTTLYRDNRQLIRLILKRQDLKLSWNVGSVLWLLKHKIHKSNDYTVNHYYSILM